MATLFKLKAHLEAGGKVKNSDGICYRLDDGGYLVTDSNSSVVMSFKDILQDDWEIYEENKRWKPKGGEFYNYIHSTGLIGLKNDIHTNDDYKRIAIHNCFKSQKDAEQVRDRWIAERELLEMTDYKKGNVYTFYYDKGLEDFVVEMYSSMYVSPYRFATQESCKRAIDTLGSEKLRLIFNIKE